MRVQRGERGRSRGLPRREDRLSRDRRARRGRARRGRRGARARSPGARRSRRRGTSARRRRACRRMSFAHRDPRSRAPDPRPRGRALLRVARRRPAAARSFYVGFPPPSSKTKRKGIEYGVGMIPLGGFVSIPGMHRPIPHDAERRFSRAVAEAPRSPARSIASSERSTASDFDRALPSARRARSRRCEAQRCRLRAHAPPRRARPSFATPSAPMRTGRRRPGSGSSRSAPAPRRTSLLTIVALHVPVHDRGRTGDSTIATSPRARAGASRRRRRSGSWPEIASSRSTARRCRPTRSRTTDRRLGRARARADRGSRRRGAEARPGDTANSSKAATALGFGLEGDGPRPSRPSGARSRSPASSPGRS